MFRVILVLALLLPAAAFAQESASAVPVVLTTGEATLQRTPDVAFVTVSVESRASNPRDAQRQNSDAMTAVQARLTTARVPKESIRTVQYDIHQEFDFVNGRQVPRGYVARNAVEVKAEMARLADILDTVVQAGATTVSGIRFDVTDRDAVEREALRMAVADARARAEAAASGAGRSIDRIIRIEEAREAPIVMRRMAAAAPAMAEAGGVPIEAGTIEITAHVTMTAALK